MRARSAAVLIGLTGAWAAGGGGGGGGGGSGSTAAGIISAVSPVSSGLTIVQRDASGYTWEAAFYQANTVAGGRVTAV